MILLLIEQYPRMINNVSLSYLRYPQFSFKLLYSFVQSIECVIYQSSYYCYYLGFVVDIASLLIEVIFYYVPIACYLNNIIAEIVCKEQIQQVFAKIIIFLHSYYIISKEAKMIIPSKEVLLIVPAQGKQLFMFDPKTGCILQKFNSESALGPSAGYYESAQQLIMPHLNNSYVNIWDSDAQEARKFSIGDGQRVCSLLIYEQSLAFMGSFQGNLYIFELPSGINIRKISLHSSPIKNLHLLETGYLLSCTQNQLKLWAMRDLLYSKQAPIAQKSIHSVSKIISMSLTRNIVCILNENAVKLFFAHNLTQYQCELPELKNNTCICSSRIGFYVGNSHGKIKIIKIEGESRKFIFNKDKKNIQIQKSDILEIDAKDPLTSITFVQSLNYLISGSYKGELKIWENNKLKNSMTLFKTSISFVYCFPKPSKEIKINQNAKIKSLHKQQLSKLEQPIIVYSQSQQKQTQKSNDEYLSQMLDYLNDPAELMESEIQILKAQNRKLVEANIHYESMLEVEENNK